MIKVTDRARLREESGICMTVYSNFRAGGKEKFAPDISLRSHHPLVSEYASYDSPSRLPTTAKSSLTACLWNNATFRNRVEMRVLIIF